VRQVQVYEDHILPDADQERRRTHDYVRHVSQLSEEMEVLKITYVSVSIMLVDVDTTDGVYLAKVIRETSKTYVLRYLMYKKKGLYVYDSEEEVEKSCVCGLYDPDDTEKDAGFLPVEGGFIRVDNEDDEYEPSESETESETESLVDEDDDEA